MLPSRSPIVALDTAQALKRLRCRAAGSFRELFIVCHNASNYRNHRSRPAGRGTWRQQRRASDRLQIYAEWCRQHPNDAQVVAVAEPRPWRLKTTSDANNVPEDMRFADWEPLLAKGKIADAVAIAVLDDMHAEIVDKCAKLGYAILCEKVNPRL